MSLELLKEIRMSIQQTLEDEWGPSISKSLRPIYSRMDAAIAEERVSAAAPDLLDVVERYLRYHDGENTDYGCDPDPKPCDCAVCVTAREVIAKITGDGK